jgi:DNA-binding CsgD family transcriptional regulator
VFGVFILLGLSVLYSCTAILVLSWKSKASGLIVLRGAVKTAGALFPFIFIIDLVRYFFPALWKVLPQERQLFTPLCFLILNLYFMNYIESAFTKTVTQSFNGLSVRENQVASLLCEGESYKEIASRLFISLATVQTHVSKIYRKTGVKTKADLILLKNRSVLPYDP